MDRLTYERLDSILRQVLETPLDEREAFLTTSCGRDPQLRATVDRMLAAAESDDSVLRPGGALSGPLWEAEIFQGGVFDDLPAGHRIGNYRIVELVGRGGMASVYLGARADGQFDQHVALKILDSIRPSDELFKRFEQERQILAKLEHPNIARLLDGGLTDAGRPYVAMEYTAGKRIDEYCDDNRLTIRDRVRLMSGVLDAVEYAHRNLIVHRDIKPSNILVTDEGVPKLLDFGIAKLLDPSAPHAVPDTRTAMRPMTPEYASPEQVRGERLTIAADVYQLGLLLYAWSRVVCPIERAPATTPRSCTPSVTSSRHVQASWRLQRGPTMSAPRRSRTVVRPRSAVCGASSTAMSVAS